MRKYLNVEVDALEACGSLWTAREICQQPRIWREAYAMIEQSRPFIDRWLQPVLAKSALRIILSGAGSSSFIGETLAPALRKQLRRRVEAVSTTDLLGAPDQYLAEDVPTLMISFARSGDSPESVAAVELANQILGDCHHLVLTCNPEGRLAQAAGRDANMLCRLMPEGTNDRSFAMTSSFSSMLLSCAAIFMPAPEQLEQAAELTQGLINTQALNIQALARQDCKRLVVLGAGCLLGTAREAALKSLELSAGRLVSMADTPLGFRHGPKSVIDEATLIIHLQSAHPYIQQYDADLFRELHRDGQSAGLVALSPSSLGPAARELQDLWLSLPYLVYCQSFAFFKALALDITADNPFPSGEVNRVVKGVTIRPYTKGL